MIGFFQPKQLDALALPLAIPTGLVPVARGILHNGISLRFVISVAQNLAGHRYNSGKAHVLGLARLGLKPTRERSPKFLKSPLLLRVLCASVFPIVFLKLGGTAGREPSQNLTPCA
jgi:hypothetical protein